MSWLSTFFNEIGNGISSWFSGLPEDGKELLAYLKPALESDRAAILNKIVAIGEPIVAGIATGGILSAPQVVTAIEQIGSAVVSAGIADGEQLLASAVGFILAKLQAGASAAASASVDQSNGAAPGTAAPASGAQ